MKKAAEFPENLLHSRNLKVTTTRSNLLKAIRAYGTAMPYALIQNQLAGTDRVTLYRTIETLLEKGLIHQAYSSNKEIYYALCGEKCTATQHFHNHIHFQCTACLKVTCEHSAEPIRISLPNFNIQKININATGICQHCHSTM